MPQPGLPVPVPLTLHPVQFVPWTNDRCLSSSVNFVRGEDSVVRAIWAERAAFVHTIPSGGSVHGRSRRFSRALPVGSRRGRDQGAARSGTREGAPDAVRSIAREENSSQRAAIDVMPRLGRGSATLPEPRRLSKASRHRYIKGSPINPLSLQVP